MKGIGVPCGEMKGVLDSEAEPKVAALEIFQNQMVYYKIRWGQCVETRALHVTHHKYIKLISYKTAGGGDDVDDDVGDA